MKSTLNEDVIKPKALQFDVNMLDKMVMHSPHRNLQPRNQLNQQYLYKNYVGIGVETVKVIGTVAHGI